MGRWEGILFLIPNKKNEIMRQLNPEFMEALGNGHLKELINLVRTDDSLDFQIREGYLNIYFKGNNILKLHSNYKITIDKNLTKGINVEVYLKNPDAVTGFIQNLPYIKHQITLHSSRAIEREYEQMFIRSNNCDLNESEYFILDRQYTRPNETNSQLDMVGLHWARNGRRNKDVPLSIFEIKYALNNDISTIHDQLCRYHELVENNFNDLVIEMNSLIQQKTSLKVLSKKSDIDNNLSKLRIVNDPSSVHYVIVLVDYNPNSSLLNLVNLNRLLFCKQVKIFHCGLGLWSQFFGRIC